MFGGAGARVGNYILGLRTCAYNTDPPRLHSSINTPQSAKGYVNYLIALFFKPEYTGFQDTDGFIATKGAKGT